MRTRAREPGRRSEVLALYAATVACYADMYVTQPVLPLLSAEFRVAPARAGLSVSAVVLAVAAASGVYGPLSDAVGRKRVMAWSAFALVVPTVLCAATRSFSALLALRAAQGLLIPGVTAVSVAYAGDQVGRERLPVVVGGIIGASVAGGLVGRVVSGLVASVAGWRAGFVVFGILTAIAAALLARSLRPGGGQARVAWRGAYRGMLAHLVDRRLVGAFLIGETLFFGFIGIFTYLPYHLTAPPYRLSTALVSSVYLVYLAGVVASPLAGRLAARRSPRGLMAAGLATAIAGACATLLAPLLAVVAGLVVLCVGMFTAQAIAPGFVNASAATAKGGANALYLAFYYVGGTLGSVLPGLAWQAWRWPGVVAACVASLACGILADALLCGAAPRAVARRGGADPDDAR